MKIEEIVGRISGELAAYMEQHVAALTKERNDALEQVRIGVLLGQKYQSDLAASQAREKKLRGLLGEYLKQVSDYDGRTSQSLEDEITEALVIPADAMLAERAKRNTPTTVTVAQCKQCGRLEYDITKVGESCQMLQSNGSRCLGVLR